MTKQAVEPDKLRERLELLQKCLSMALIEAYSYANSWTDEQLVEAINGTVRKMTDLNMRRPAGYPENYFGEFYSIQNYQLSVGSVWDRMQGDILRCLKAEPEAREVVDFLLNQVDYQADFTGIKARFARWRNTLDALLGFKLLRKLPGRAKDVTTYALHAEMVPLLRRVLASDKAQDIPAIRCQAAQAEVPNVEQMEKEFQDYLSDLLDKRLDEVTEFGREQMSIEAVAGYLEGLFGPMLYFDILLALAEQYGMTATEIINQEGVRAGSTGFHLALFGAPGTGKTFAIKDIIMGDEGKGVKPHGLPGLNRYCGGMTAANFIRIGEAYQGKRFNFVVTEFNDWFRYKGMVEPLKLALEQGRIRYETKAETVGPYQFSCYFSTNYNTQVSKEAGYRVTVSDPNFNAIEDRMLVRMHRMTKQRLRELSRNQRDLALGRLKMHLAGDIRDHLTLVYAIQTQHPLVRGRFAPKQIVLRESFFDALEKAQALLRSPCSRTSGSRAAASRFPTRPATWRSSSSWRRSAFARRRELTCRRSSRASAPQQTGPHAETAEPAEKPCPQSTRNPKPETRNAKRATPPQKARMERHGRACKPARGICTRNHAKPETRNAKRGTPPRMARMGTDRTGHTPPARRA